MTKALFCLCLAATLIHQAAHAQSRSTSTSVKVTNFGAANNISIDNIPPPSGDPILNRKLSELDNVTPMITPITIGSDTLNGSNNLLITPNANGAF